MSAAKELKLEELKARDLASGMVITVPLDLSLKGLAMVLNDNKVSGAPVVDEEGRMIGVVSKSDLVRYSANGQTPSSEWPDYFRALDEEDIELLSEAFYTEDYQEARVVDIYTPKVITATPEDSIAHMARAMADHRVHRLVIVEDGRPVGVISALDILAILGGKAPRGARKETAVRRPRRTPEYT